MTFSQTQKEAIVSIVIEMINADHVVSLEELKISRSYVSRIEKRALTKLLKKFIKNN